MADLPRHTIGVCLAEEEHEFILQIRNFLYVQQHEELLTSQTSEVEFGKASTIWSRWLVGLKANAERIITVYLKLVEQHDAPLLVKGSLHHSTTGEQETWGTCLCNIVEAKPVATNHEFLLKCPSSWKYKETGWTDYCDSNGTFYLKVKLSVLVTKPLLEQAMDSAAKAFSTGSQALLRNNLDKMLGDPAYADLTIVCSDGKELKAHRNILSARNSVFEATLRAEMSERDTGILRIDDISEETMKILLHYMYTGDLLTVWCRSENMMEFVYAAGKYQLAEVLTFLDNVLGMDEIPVCTLQLLSLINKLGLKKAEELVTQKIVKLANKVKTGEELLKMFSNTSLQESQSESNRALPDKS